MSIRNFTERIRPAPPETAAAWYEIRNAVEGDSTTARIDLYAEIDPFWGVSAQDFVADLRQLDAETIELHINSPGGSVYDGVAIMNALRQHTAKVVTVVDGLAASAAGFIAVGASDELVMAENSELMIHEAWGVSVGSAADMRTAAEDLDRVSANIASIYARKAGGTAEDWRTVMEAETWYSAAETVAAGLADRVLTTGKPSKAKNRHDLSIFNFAGRAQAPAPRLSRNALPQPNSSAIPAEIKGTEGAMPTLGEALRERLGLADDADEDAVLEAFDQAVTTAPPEQVPAEPSAQQITASASKLGLVLVDRAAYEQTVASANKGAAAYEQLATTQRNSVLDRHVRRGALATGRREHFAKLLELDPEGIGAILDSLPDGAVVPLNEIGHAGEPETDPLEHELSDVFARVTGTTGRTER